MCRRDVDTRVCLFFVACFLCLLLVFRRAPVRIVADRLSHADACAPFVRARRKGAVWSEWTVLSCELRASSVLI